MARFSLAILCGFFLLCCLQFQASLSSADGATGVYTGGIHGHLVNGDSSGIDSLGIFAVEEYNKKQNSMLKFVKVLDAKEQVVAGMLYYITLEAVDGGTNKIYEAKVWEKVWMNFKQLDDFKFVRNA